MKIGLALLALTSTILFTAAPSIGQTPPTGKDPMQPVGRHDSSAQPSAAGQSDAGKGSPAADGSAEAAKKNAQTELDLPEDSSISVRVEPIVPGTLVDRVMEPAKVLVTCPGALSAEVFVVAVDAPYGGRALEKPRLVGRDNKAADKLTVAWTQKEPDQYVKIFAVVRKRNQPERRVRSHTIDLAMGGSRYAAQPVSGAAGSQASAATPRGQTQQEARPMPAPGITTPTRGAISAFLLCIGCLTWFLLASVGVHIFQLLNETIIRHYHSPLLHFGLLC